MDNGPLSRPAFEQGNGNGPPTTQTYSMPQLSPTPQSTTTNQYPQYSYDIQMRYSEDPNRSTYPQDASQQYQQDTSSNQQQQQQDIPRQYTQPGPYAKELPSHYSRLPQTQNHYSSPPMPNHSPPLLQGQGVQLPSLSMSMQQAPHPGYGGHSQEMPMDTTGQVAPAGMKPRVTATLWEDEGTLCFQVDVKGTCVARREDNHMINGTKLLNVAGMTRGRRDGILKAEKQKHVVKIGPMHLKGVWIPYDRALLYANKENITPLLYPIFVHNIGALLYHPINHARGQLPHLKDGTFNPPQGAPFQNQEQGQGQDQGRKGYPVPGSGNGEAVMFNSAREHQPER